MPYKDKKIRNRKQYENRKLNGYFERKKLTINWKFNEYKHHAKERGIEFSLTKEEFASFRRKDCFYCGTKIENIGIDRIDNNVGYIISNIVPCCKNCNMAKSTLTVNGFVSLCRKVVNKFNPSPNYKKHEQIEQRITRN